MTRANTKKISLSIRIILILSALILTGTLMASAGINPLQFNPKRVVTIYTENGSLEVNTNKTLVADILEEANITVDMRYERTSPSLDEELESNFILIEKAAIVIIKVDGQELEVISWAITIEDLLVEQSITIDGDIINFPLEESLRTGQEIEIIRVVSELVYEEIAIAAKITYINDSSLVIGKVKVQTQAQDGMKKITYEVIYNDGIEVSRSTISEEVIVEPVVGIIMRGTQPVPSRSAPSSNDSVTGIASWYGAELHGNKTASGVPFDMYALTAAHKTLPFGTMVKVTYLETGISVVVEINDRGPNVPGRIIDLSAASAKVIGLYADGIGEVRLEILK